MAEYIFLMHAEAIAFLMRDDAIADEKAREPARSIRPAGCGGTPWLLEPKRFIEGYQAGWPGPHLPPFRASCGPRPLAGALP
jgi:hypothetical protein